MPNAHPPLRSREISEALNLMTQALQLLADNDVPSRIEEHLDRAISSLTEFLVFRSPGS